MLERVDERGPSIDISVIEAFENKHGIRLPVTYKRFLLETNGGRPHPENFPISGLDKNPFGSIQAFYGFGAVHKSEDLNVILDELQSQSVPKGILPIGCTGYEGTQIVIDLRDPGEPVKFFDSIPFWGNNIWNESYLYPVAANFAALLASLKTDEEIGLSVRESSEN